MIKMRGPDGNFEEIRIFYDLELGRDDMVSKCQPLQKGKVGGGIIKAVGSVHSSRD